MTDRPADEVDGGEGLSGSGANECREREHTSVDDVASPSLGGAHALLGKAQGELVLLVEERDQRPDVGCEGQRRRVAVVAGLAESQVRELASLVELAADRAPDSDE